MTISDVQFLKEMGIDPRSLDDPFPSPLPSPPAPDEAPIPKLAEKDSRWLQDLRVTWEQDPEPGFVPPKTLQEYLTKHPTGINEATRAVAKEMGIALPAGVLDDLAQEITQMFLDFLAADLEDVVAMFPFDKSFRPRAGEHGSAKFQRYVRFRVKAAVQSLLKLDPSRGWNRG
jgi:hypothetical protein